MPDVVIHEENESLKAKEIEGSSEWGEKRREAEVDGRRRRWSVLP